MANYEPDKVKKRDLRWRKFYPHWWLQPELEGLSRDEKLVWNYLLHGPETNRIGYFRLRARHAALDFGMTEQEFQCALDNVVKALGWRHDPATGVTWITTYFRDDPPVNPSQTAGIVKDMHAMPRSRLDVEFRDAVDFLKPSLAGIFRQAVQSVINGVSNSVDVAALSVDGGSDQEPEPEPEPEQDHLPDPDLNPNHEKEPKAKQQPTAAMTKNADRGELSVRNNGLKADAQALSEWARALYSAYYGVEHRYEAGEGEAIFSDLLKAHSRDRLRDGLSAFFLRGDDWTRRQQFPLRVFAKQLNTHIGAIEKFATASRDAILRKVRERAHRDGGGASPASSYVSRNHDDIGF